MKDSISPSEFVSIFFKSDSILMNTLVLVHMESNKFLRHSFDAIRVAEYCFEFVGKGGPGCHLWGLIPLFDVSPEMPLGSAGEMLYHVNDASPVCGIIQGLVSKTKPHSKRKSWSLEFSSPENFTGA